MVTKEQIVEMKANLKQLREYTIAYNLGKIGRLNDNIQYLQCMIKDMEIDVAHLRAENEKLKQWTHAPDKIGGEDEGKKGRDGIGDELPES